MALETQAFDAATWTVTAGGGLMGLRWLYMTLRRDVQEVKVDDEQDKLVTHWKEIATNYQNEAKENARRADLFADQRNRAIEEVGQLRGKVEALTLHINNLEKHVELLTAQVEKLHGVLVNCTQCPSGAAVIKQLPIEVEVVHETKP